MIPPKQNAAFVADMEAVLDLYAEPYDPAPPSFPRRAPLRARRGSRRRATLPMRAGTEARQDHEYVRGGLCSPCWPSSRSRLPVGLGLPQRRRVEFARVVRQLCDEVYPGAERVRLVCDQSDAHGAASFYEAFDPAEARRIAAKVEFVHTPVHGSWLNVVECEFSALVRQCLGRRRLGTVEALRREIEVWVAARNAEGSTVEWQFTTDDARVKLRRLYPSI